MIKCDKCRKLFYPKDTINLVDGSFKPKRGERIIRTKAIEFSVVCTGCYKTLLFKFKKGDRVKISKKSIYFGQFKGIGVITGFRRIEDHPYHVKEVTSDYTNYYEEDDLILVKEDTTAQDIASNILKALT